MVSEGSVGGDWMNWQLWSGKNQEEELSTKRSEQKMFSAAPLVKNDRRIPEIVERLKKGANLTLLSKELGYWDHVQFRNVLKDMIGMEAYAELMAGRAK